MQMQFNADFSAIVDFVRTADDMASLLASSNFHKRVQNSLRRSGEFQFGQHADHMAMADKSSLHHVYEWGRIGTPPGRLFRFVWTGASADKTASFRFLQSKREVPRGDVWGDFREQRHVFRGKAWLMENGYVTTIRPINGKYLAWAENGEMRFSSKPLQVAIGRNTMGKFAAMWNAFWNTQAEQRVAEPIANTIDRAVQREASKVIAAINVPTVSARSGRRLQFNVVAARSPENKRMVNAALRRLNETAGPVNYDELGLRWGAVDEDF